MGDAVHVQITTLGALAVDGQPVRGDKLVALIAALLEARGRVVSSAALVEDVWEGIPPDDAGGAVQALVSRARRLGLPVAGAPGGYRLPTDDLEIDAAQAEDLLERARAAMRSGDPATAHRLSAEARALVPPVPDLSDAATARLLGEVVALRAESGLAVGDTADVVDDLRRCALRTPPDEPLVALLVRVLASQGRDAEALEVVERVREELADRYGTDPSPVVAQAHLALLRGELSAAPAVIPTSPVRSVLPGSWRRPATALVGRDEDVAELEALLETSPLVTIVATGGAGKTRLATEVSRRAVASGRGVRVIELAGLRGPSEVLPTVLAAIGGGDATATRVDIAPERRLLAPEDRLRIAAQDLDGLLVLDNCEHVLEAAAAVVGDLLAVASDDVVVLATSRAPLGLVGEAVHRLRTLPDADALALLEARARAGRAGVGWDPDRALELCHRLDNLPLALELAAARLRSMTVEDVLGGLTDRFSLLDDALRGLPERHASLWAMVDWSRELLAPVERDLLQRVSVIPAPFTAEAAIAVAGHPAAPRPTSAVHAGRAVAAGARRARRRLRPLPHAGDRARVRRGTARRCRRTCGRDDRARALGRRRGRPAVRRLRRPGAGRRLRADRPGAGDPRRGPALGGRPRRRDRAGPHRRRPVPPVERAWRARRGRRVGAAHLQGRRPGRPRVVGTVLRSVVGPTVARRRPDRLGRRSTRWSTQAWPGSCGWPRWRGEPSGSSRRSAPARSARA